MLGNFAAVEGALAADCFVVVILDLVAKILYQQGNIIMQVLVLVGGGNAMVAVMVRHQVAVGSLVFHSNPLHRYLI